MAELDPWSPEGRTERLRTLFKAWQSCKNCRLHEHRTQVVFGNGRPEADIMLIGEAPGELEDETGDAFVGESGQLLNSLLTAAKLTRDDTFVTNLVLCRPEKNRVPMRDEREACLSRLYQQIYIIDPLLIIPVGAEAMQALMGGEWKSIQKLHGKIGWIGVPGLVEDIVRYPAMPILHPSFILREDRISRETKNWETGGLAHKTWQDLVRARQRISELKSLYPSRNVQDSKVAPARKHLRVVK